MLGQLVESSPKRVRGRFSTLVSIIAHGLVLTAAVAAARPVPKEPPEKPVIIWHPPPPPLPPDCTGCASRSSGGQAGRIHQGAASIPKRITINFTIGVPEKVGPISEHVPISSEEWLRVPAGRSGEATSPPGREAVDREVVPLRSNPVPQYPAALRTAGIEGSVSARFVVDTTGRVIMESVIVDAADHPLFADAVIEALRRARFTPAELRGRKVRQLVVQPFVFVIRD